MPVGPLGVLPDTVNVIVGLVVRRAVRLTQFGRGHVVPARNAAWKEVVALNDTEQLLEPIDRVLWLDADVSAPLEELIAWMARADERFAAAPSVGWIAAVVARRGGGWAYRPENVVANARVEGQDVEVKQPLLAGLGLAYWHLPRVLEAFERANISRSEPFSWVPPYSEDTGISMELSAFGGCEVEIDPSLPTTHDGIGSWPGGALAPHQQQEVT